MPINHAGWVLLEEYYGDDLDDLLEDETETDDDGHRFFDPQMKGRGHQPDTMKSAEPPPETDESKDLQGLMHYFRLQNSLIWGGQGSGKTSMVRAIAADKLKHGQQVAVLNPHGNAAGWQGMQLIGAGKNYSAVEIFMGRYLALIKERYQFFESADVTEDEFLEQLLREGKIRSTICEELSGWSTNVDQTLLHEFIRTALTESRKVGLPMILVAHDPSLEFVGLKKGARLRDKGVVVAEMEPGIADLDNGILKATGKGKLQLPGQKDAISFVFTQTTLADLKAEGIAAPAISPNLFTPIVQPAISAPVTFEEEKPVTYAEPPQVYPTEVPTPKQKLERIFKLDVAQPTQTNEVGAIEIDYSAAHEFLHPLIQYSIKYGWVTARIIKQNVRAYGRNTTEEIREFFVKASETVGSLRGDNDKLQYAAKPNETREKV
ncbi:MAG: hypothetical protein DCF22_23405 [Leptolyngbya sp.]|nr:MAG: hypothetical protein DCF22_23405 [Leptolyngbya sp.]